MIVPILKYRFGNQCFQIAAAVATAIKNKTNVFIPSATKFEYNLGHGTPDFSNCKTIKVHKEKEKFKYNQIPYKEGDGLYIDGFFQCYKYFDWCVDEVRNKLGFSYNMKNGLVSIHVRRGDYLALKSWPVVDVSYIRKAVSHFSAMGYKEFRFFSDDIKWCESIDGYLPRDCDFTFSRNTSERTDMQEMINCEHNIISNSSFSAMASLLNGNKDKVVIMPKVWNNLLNTDGFLPESYIRI